MTYRVSTAEIPQRFQMKGSPDGERGGKAPGQLGEGRNLGANVAEIAAAARGVSAALAPPLIERAAKSRLQQRIPCDVAL